MKHVLVSREQSWPRMPGINRSATLIVFLRIIGAVDPKYYPSGSLIESFAKKLGEDPK